MCVMVVGTTHNRIAKSYTMKERRNLIIFLLFSFSFVACFLPLFSPSSGLFQFSFSFLRFRPSVCHILQKPIYRQEAAKYPKRRLMTIISAYSSQALLWLHYQNNNTLSLRARYVGQHLSRQLCANKVACASQSSCWALQKLHAT